ncbi:hypothetical protein V9T40_004103 [Parthenolecanium corni]|uniref:Uncharacterized protein n=1 Tax=Parthenolecanium corni TaxID=536013 RepID=A0AAN9TGX9_9HEMI
MRTPQVFRVEFQQIYVVFVPSSRSPNGSRLLKMRQKPPTSSRLTEAAQYCITTDTTQTSKMVNRNVEKAVEVKIDRRTDSRVSIEELEGAAWLGAVQSLALRWLVDAPEKKQFLL